MAVVARYTMADQVALNARSFPERLAIEDVGTGRSYTYGQLWDRVTSIAAELERAGQGSDQPLVGVLVPNGADVVAVYLACQWSGYGAVPVNHHFTLDETVFVLTDARCSVVLSSGILLGKAEEAAALVGATVVDVGSIRTTPAPDVAPTHDDVEKPAHIAYVQYTSGTTGFPKGVIYSNERLLLTMMVYFWHFELRRDDVMLVAGPMFHLSYGGFPLAALIIGARVRILAEFDADNVVDELKDRSTWAFLVPTMVWSISDTAQRRGLVSLPALRFMLSSGASITPELLARAHELMPNTRIGEVYGFSEGGPVSFEVKQADTLRPQCVGWPILGADVRIVDDDGNDCAIGSPGEVAVRNIAPFEGFVNNESRARLMDGGYVLSGDIAIRDDDGRLRLVDRKADMIVTGGENVYSAEVERVLANHLGVQEVAVVGSPDEKWGEIVTAVVVTTDDGAFDPQKFDETCRKELAPFKRPRRVVFRTAEEMPRSALGKVQKFVLREQLRAEFSILNPR